MFRQKKIRPQAAQDSLILQGKLYPQSNYNHRSVAVEIIGPINIDAFIDAFDLLVTRHEMLRAVVKNDGTESYFHISSIKKKYSAADLPLRIIDVTHLQSSPSVDDLHNTLKKVNQAQFIEEPFSLNKGPLWRTVLVKIAENKYHFSMMFNHIIIDENSIGVIFKDLSAFYNILVIDEPVQTNLLEIPSLTTTDLSLPLEEIDSRLSYWKKQLDGLNVVNLQTDFPPHESFRFTGKRRPFTLDKNLILGIEANLQLKGQSLNQILIAALYSLLYRYSGETDICIGITSANRRHPIVEEKIIGQIVNCFFNSIPLRLAFSENSSFLSLLSQVKNSLSNALKKQLPLDMIYQKTINAETKSSLRIASPFDIMLVFNEIKPTLTFHNTTATQPIELDLGYSKFPYFGLNIDKYPDGSCKCFIEFNTDLFTEKTIDQFINHFCQSLRHISEDPQCNISTIPLLLVEEKILIDNMNHRNDNMSSPVCLVHDFFHNQALEYPHDPFVIYHNESLTSLEKLRPERLSYQQIDIHTTQFANYLTKFGVGPNVKVGICLSRSPNLIIAMLAVLKAGGIIVTFETKACTLLDNEIQAPDISIILIDNQTQSFFENSNKLVLNLQAIETEQSIRSCDADYQSPKLNPQDPAYIMYTSGTSGETPKGVIQTHLGFANLLHYLHYDHNLRPDRKVICTALPTFDAFLFDLLVAIASVRGQLHLCNEDDRYSAKMLTNIMRNAKINYGAFLPETLAKLDPQLLPLVDDVISMGASPHEDTLITWANAKLDRRVWNGLGHTETSICLFLCQYSNGSDPTLIGQPIRNMKAYIVNPTNLSLCPPGVRGEIYVAGPGVAKGYVDNDELTAEKFPEMIFDGSINAIKRCEPGAIQLGAERFYATGDYGCYKYLNDNEIGVKFICRMDRQIKIHGVKVDLDVVESVLLKHPLIKNIVVTSNKKNTVLTAYIVPSTDAITTKEFHRQIREYLATTLLPSVAFPNNLILLEHFRITQNGKIDIRALPNPESFHTELIEAEPLTDLQIKILEIWSKTLDIPVHEISIHQTFRELNGNSLSRADIETELNKALSLTSHVDITSMSMTIKSLSEKLEQLLNQRSRSKHLIVGSDIQINYGNGAVLFFTNKKSRETTPERNNSPEEINTDTISQSTTKDDNLRVSK